MMSEASPGTSTLFDDARRTGWSTVQLLGRQLEPFSTFEDDKLDLVESVALNNRRGGGCASQLKLILLNETHR